MKIKNDLETLIEIIQKKTRYTQAQVASRINYSRTHFSLMKKSEPSQLKELLEAAFFNELNGIEAPKEGNITLEDRALIQVLLFEAIQNKAYREKISEDEASEEIRKSTNLVKRSLQFGA